MPKMPDINKFVTETNLRGFMIVEMATVFFLNVLMIISGIGLLSLKEWAAGRASDPGSRAQDPSADRSVLVLCSNSRAEHGQGIHHHDQRDVRRNGQGPAGVKKICPDQADFERFGSMLGAMGTTYAMGMIILGVIYPVIVTIAH